MKIQDLDNYSVIKWRLTDICNYRCSYCIRKPFIETRENIDSDWNKNIKALPHIKRIANELNQNTQKQIKIDLIGGEISLFENLLYLISELFEEDIIQEVNLTTNLCRNAEYYIELFRCAKKMNKTVSMTASFHPEYANLKDFMTKVEAILKDDVKNRSVFKSETVITNANNQVADFVKRCEELNCFYMCEEDMHDTSKRGQSVTNHKPTVRYSVENDNGNVTLYTTRNEVIKTFGEEGKYIATAGGKCTRDYDYTYVEQDMAIPCHNKIPIEEYNVHKNKRICQYPFCTLCGHMSFEKESKK